MNKVNEVQQVPTCGKYIHDICIPIKMCTIKKLAFVLVQLAYLKTIFLRGVLLSTFRKTHTPMNKNYNY